ncbi:MAG: type I-MYXAN CRISPR-associated protein Cas6/Cmx6 [Rhodocyclaceae bacterium]|nr:type I-MYXAN CRISPR-associated protein Cas6/Cmx6 [Rhodocyclaceae bacterium]
MGYVFHANDSLDISFVLSGQAVKKGYAERLKEQLCEHLPWLMDEPLAGVHSLHRVGEASDELYLSRHSRLILRLPRERQELANGLTGVSLELGDSVTIGTAKPRELAGVRMLYSAFVTMGESEESAFLEACRHRLSQMDIFVPLLCGKARQEGLRVGFSLMLQGLDETGSLRVQREGLGGDRLLGCGLFVEHKSVAPVGGWGR